MDKTVNYVRVWDDVSCGNTCEQFAFDCQKRGYSNIKIFPEYGEPRLAIAAESKEILENSAVYKHFSKMDVI